MTPHSASVPALSLGRYQLFDEIASGGMGSVHFGHLSGPAGFSRVVAIKRLHANYAKDPEFVRMFLQEARLAARIRHVSVVATLDVVANEGEVFLVMDYVHGQSLANLSRAMRSANRATDPRIVAAVVGSVLRGLHAAHEAKDEQGRPLRIVHRDVSPQNVLVGVDGVARVLDFGVAKASGQVQSTQAGRIKGKLAYMPPEQLRGETVTRRTDLYSAGVVTWELLTGQRAFAGQHEAAVITAILERRLERPSTVNPELPPAFDAVVMRALHHLPHQRYATAQEMAVDLENCVGTASMAEVAEWVQSCAGEELGRRARQLARIEGTAEPNDSSLSSSPIPREIPTVPNAISAGVSPDQATVSRIALTSTMSRLKRDPRKRLAVIACVSIAAIAGIAALLRTTGRNSDEVAAPPWPSAVASAIASQGPIGPAPITSPTALASPTSAAAPAIDVTQLPAAPNPAPGGPYPHAGLKPKRDCNPPFTIDESGHKLYKAACFK